MDFEDAVWRAAEHVFPVLELKGCAFHFTRAIWRKIQEFGLHASYTSDDGSYKFLKKVMALCFLPASHIPAVFRRLQTSATTEPLKKLMTMSVVCGLRVQCGHQTLGVYISSQ